jgi:hypothetical protein
MLYGIIAVVDQILISNDAGLKALDLDAFDFFGLDFVAPDAARERPRARAPDTPSSTR